MPSQTFDQLEQSIRAGKIERLYLFDGPERWLKERAVQQIIKKLLPDDARDFNLEKFDGNSSSGGEIVSSARSLPFLADRRVIVVSSAEEFKVGDGRLIAEGLADLPASTCVIFLYEGKAALRDEIPALVMSYGVVATFWTPFPNQMPRWVTSEAKARGKQMAYDAAETLADACEDLQDVANELDKLILFVGKKPAITLQDVLAHGLPDEVGDQRALEGAVYQRDLREALNQTRLLSEMGVRAEMIFPTFERILRQLLLGHYQIKEKGRSVADLFTAMRMRGKTQQANFTEGLRRYSPHDIIRSFDRLAESEFQLKTGQLTSELVLSLLTLAVIQPGEN